MIGIVIVSHSQLIAEGIKEYAETINTKGIKIVAAGGADDGRIGTNTLRIIEAIEEIKNERQILVMIDLGSAILSTEMAIDMLEDDIKDKIKMIDAPLFEGTIAAVEAVEDIGSIDELLNKILDTKKLRKL